MKYHYVGDGAGVVGLPHEITDEEAKRDGQTALLAAALDNGSYVAVETVSPSPSTAERKARSSAQGNERKDVNNG